MRDLLPTDPSNLRLPEGLLVRTRELRYEDDALHQVPLHEVIFAPFPAQEDLCYLGAYGSHRRFNSCTEVRAVRKRGRLSPCRLVRTGPFPGRGYDMG